MSEQLAWGLANSRDKSWREAKARIADLEAEVARLQERGDGYKSESETSFDRARRAEKALEEAQGKLRYQEPMIKWYGVMVGWFAQHVRSGESNQELLPRLDRILRGPKEVT